MSPTRNGDVLSWASEIDENTMEQAQRTAALPFVDKPVALMPDAHFGMGATVGSVIATKGAIVPAAVGVDIGCVDADSEYLSPRGWRRIADYDGGPVMAYDPHDGTGRFVKPSRYIRREQSWFLHLHTKYGIDQALTPDHRILCWDLVGRDRRQVQTTVTAAEFVARHGELVLGNKALFETSFTPSIGTRLDLTDDDLRVMVMLMADGTIDGPSCVLHFTKERKIARAKQLLAAAGIEFTSGVSTGASWIRFRPPRTDKSYAWCWPASYSQLLVIVDEVFHWDGNAADRCFFTRDEGSADFMQYAFTATGHRGVKRGDVHASGKIDWRVYAHNNTRVAIAGTPKTEVDEIPSTDGYAYCFTVDTGYWVMRRGGNVVMTGNCGMIALETGLTSHALPDNLGPLHGLIRAAVPAGVGQGHDTRDRHRSFEHWPGAMPSAGMTDRLAVKALDQFGSLGSGNHFVEVCLDESDVVWVVLHSGSRGVGNELAKVHIDGAKALMARYFIDLADPDLAYLVEGTPEFDAYIADMLWAQAYAMGNREAMMDAVVAALVEFLEPGSVLPVVGRINCHHNFTEQENHHGRNVWLTRKGAIRARTGDRGVIPGSMGTASYIVSGLGNPSSYMSCSHGAGRRMSRGQARRTLDVATFAASMAGKTWNDRDAAQLIDEDPRSYKPIEQVMADQADLVTVDHTLTQVLNYKGVETARRRRR